MEERKGNCVKVFSPTVCTIAIDAMLKKDEDALLWQLMADLEDDAVR
jgi:hypothetical protein